MKVLALNTSGTMTYCTCPPELRGKGRCNHIAHQEPGESEKDFCERVEKIQAELELEKAKKSDERFIPLEGTRIVTKPYRMSEEERSQLLRIENRMQLDKDVDGGYIEVEEPLWNDMDKNYFCKESGMPKKYLNGLLRGEAWMVTTPCGRYSEGTVIMQSSLDEMDKNGWPPGVTRESLGLKTGVKFVNEYAKKTIDFEATRYIYVIPYWMRMGIADHSDERDISAGDNGVVGEREDYISSDITIAYKYILRNHADPDRQQKAYEALLNNRDLPENMARYSNGYRNSSLADEFAGKGGVFRAVMSASSIPYSGRAVIVPNADLKFGEIAIPCAMAVDIYRPTLIKQLASEGYSVDEMDKWFSQYRVPQYSIPQEARDELDRRIQHLRIAMNRQPSLHQSSFQSFHPRISRSASAEIHPLYCTAYNADHDGDACSFYGFNDVSLFPVLDRSIAADQDVNVHLPRHHDTVTTLPTKDALFGLLSILERRKT